MTNSKKKSISFDEWKKQNQKQPDEPFNPAVSKNKQPASKQPSAVQNTNIRNWDKFHNPYHFVPAKNSGRIDRQLNHLTHDRYVDNTHSGRIICRLTSETPFFVGDERTKDASEQSPAEVANFKIDDKPAIPASSLRGLISSIAEAASNSAMRVLENRYYSYRVGMREGLGALGMIIKNEDGSYCLRPLALPLLPWNDRTNTASVNSKYLTMFTSGLLKIYIDGYQGKARTNPPEMEINPASFLATPNLKSYSADNQEYWYIQVTPSATLKGNTITCSNPRIKVSRFLNGQIATGVPISEAEYIRKGQPAGYERGILKILNIREKDIPTGKQHEIFLLYRHGIEDKLPTFDATSAVKQFHALARERTREDERLPFELKGSNRNSNPSKDNQEIELRTGDIVFFEPDKDDRSKVGEVSISSIWRRSAGGTSHDYFSAISPETLPFNPERKTITIAEQMFGFIEKDFSADKSKMKDRQAKALASRIRFSNAVFEHWEKGKDNGSDYYLAPVTLKILDSPKPPSPALYFKKKDGNGGYIPKQNLSINKHHPQGRKFYLHHADKEKKSWATNPPWETAKPTERTQQKVKIEPVRDDAVFYFHIDFDNLSDIELGLLLYSLNPSDNFHHKLGMGKPIGLGTVKIEPVGLFTINRKDRYSKEAVAIFNEKRYHNAWLKDGISSLPAIYDREKGEYGGGGQLKRLDYENIKKAFTERMDKDIQKALEIMGDPAKVTIPVHYPQLMDRDIEDENFRWFVENDDLRNRNKQYLEPMELTELSRTR